MRGRAARTGFLGLLTAAAVSLAQPPAAPAPLRGDPFTRPRLLIAERDAFSGLPAFVHDFTEGEATLPDQATARLLLMGLVGGGFYDVQLTSAVAPGAPAWRLQARANDAGVLRAAWSGKNGRLRVRRLASEQGEAR